MTSASERLAVALADRYLIERELGAGGMATVYLARDLRHDRDVAIKVRRYEDDYDVSPDAKRFLLIESETAGLSLVVVPNWRTELRRLTAGLP